MARDFFFLQQAPLDHGLGGDAGVIGAGHPQGFKTLHPLLANEDVLQRVVQGMAQVQGPGDVGRGNDYAVRLFIRIRLAVEIAFCFPKAIPLLLGGGMIVLLGEIV